MTDIRSLLFPLGYLASVLFFLRFYIQWLRSEKKKESHITPSFWIFSLTANITMGLHGLIQSQFPIALIQSTNGVIAWRNLQLMKGRKGRPIVMMIAVIVCTSLAFVLIGSPDWMRSPNHQELSGFWHLFGFLGMSLFASRFWIQWVIAEKEKQSRLHPSFWKLSLIGGICSLIYSLRLQDPVQAISFGLGLLPYIRNLALLKKTGPLQKSSLFFIAGETSGDLLGSELILSLKQQSSSLTFTGVGGPLMSAAGLACTVPMKQLNVMGFSDVLKAAPRLYKTFRQIKQTILSTMPEKVILVDYQDFNMLMAKSLRKSGYMGEIIHYVSPSVWAWRKGRMFKMAKTHNLLLSIFPFEKSYYAKTSLPVKYVGHPLVSKIQKHSYTLPFESSQKILSLFPGSRSSEITQNLSVQLEVAKKWLSFHSEFTLAISYAHDDFVPLIEEQLQKHQLKAILVPFERRYDLMKVSELAMATSGTVTLELALHSVPALVTYLLSPLNYFLGNHIFRIHLPHYCIVNIIADKTIYPEFLGKKLCINEIYQSLHEIHKNKLRVIQDLQFVSTLMGSQNASIEAAQIICSD